jgi:hypothetical protein
MMAFRGEWNKAKVLDMGVTRMQILFFCSKNLFTIFVPETITPGTIMITKLDIAHHAPGNTPATPRLYA